MALRHRGVESDRDAGRAVVTQFSDDRAGERGCDGQRDGRRYPAPARVVDELVDVGALEEVAAGDVSAPAGRSDAIWSIVL